MKEKKTKEVVMERYVQTAKQGPGVGAQLVLVGLAPRLELGLADTQKKTWNAPRKNRL